MWRREKGWVIPLTGGVVVAVDSDMPARRSRPAAAPGVKGAENRPNRRARRDVCRGVVLWGRCGVVGECGVVGRGRSRRPVG